MMSIGNLRNKNYKARLFSPHDAFWDMHLGVQTFGYHPETGRPGDDDWRVHYAPTPYRNIFRLLRAVDLNIDDCFLDLGCGMGRAVFVASVLGARKSIGVEVENSLLDQAKNNYLKSNLATRDIEFVHVNAQDFTNYECSVLFMYHPFGEKTLRDVLRNISAARSKSHRPPLRIIYVNPVYDAILSQADWLKPIGRLPGVKYGLSKAVNFDATLWTTN
jgi:SAM-dependent methyltransferase